MRKKKNRVIQPHGYAPSDDTLKSITSNLPKAFLDGGAAISLIALAYAVWCRHEGLQNKNENDLGIKCLHRIDGNPSSQGFRTRRKISRCGARIISTSTKREDDFYSKVTCICSKKHVTEIKVEHGVAKL